MWPGRRGYMNLFRQKGLTSIVYGGIVVAIIFVFLIEFRPGQQVSGASLTQQCAAEVRGTCIDPREFSAEISLIAPGRMFDPDQLRAMGLPRIVLEGMIERTLLVQDAKRLGITVGEDELSDELIAGRMRVSLPASQAGMLAYSFRLDDDLVRLLPVTNPDTGRFDLKIYERAVRQFTGRSPQDFREMQRKELLAARMRDLVRGRVRVGAAEVFEAYQREKSSASIDYVRFRREFFANEVLDLSPAAIEAWAKEHQEEVDRVAESRIEQYLPECRMARHILVRVAPEAPDFEKEEAREKIEKAVERIRKGESFDKVAREISDDGSAREGGSLGCVPKGKTVKPFEDALFALSAGQVSDIIETQFGLHVVKADAILEGDAAKAQARRDAAKTLMVAKEGEALAAETAKKVLAAAKSGKDLEEALSEALAALPKKPVAKGKAAEVESDPSLRPQVESANGFGLNGDPIPGAEENVASLVFQLEKEGDLPDDLVRLQDGYAILKLKDRTKPTEEEFESERDVFQASLLAMKQAEALNAYMDRLRNDAKAEIKINQAFLKSLDRSAEGEE